MSLKAKIGEDLKAAMRAGDAPRRDAIRLLTAALKQREVDERKELADADVIAIIEKMIKQRRESIVQFEKGGREDLAATEKFEMGVLQTYMPQALTDAEVDSAIDAAFQATGAAGLADMGKVMTELRNRIAGRADMGRVSAQVKARLAR